MSDKSKSKDTFKNTVKNILRPLYLPFRYRVVDKPADLIRSEITANTQYLKCDIDEIGRNIQHLQSAVDIMNKQINMLSDTLCELKYKNTPDSIKRVFMCGVASTVCNLKCRYCYQIQKGNNTGELHRFSYSAEQVGKALSQKRLGGCCYFEITGAGETLLQREMTGIIYQILAQGHYVGITTNGTITERINEILTFPKTFLKRVLFTFSFHYLELLRTNMLDAFFENVRQVKEAGCSFALWLVLYDDYIPHIDDIKRISLKKTGALPHISAAVDHFGKRLLTSLPDSEYIEIGRSFNSPLFDFRIKHFNVKRNEFCYAGDWSAHLVLNTGHMGSCFDYYARREAQNIFEDPDSPIQFNAIGSDCLSPFCACNSHLLTFGVIPSITTPTFAELRDRPEAGWFTPEAKAFFSTKLSNINKRYDPDVM